MPINCLRAFQMVLKTDPDDLGIQDGRVLLNQLR